MRRRHFKRKGTCRHSEALRNRLERGLQRREQGVVFRCKAEAWTVGADPAEVRAFFEAITEKMNQNDTLLYRTVGQGEDGRWICLNYWTSRPDMETLNAQAQSWAKEFAAMGASVKPNSFQLTSYATGL